MNDQQNLRNVLMTKGWMLLIAAILVACGGAPSESSTQIANDASEKLGPRDEIRLKQYKAEGAKVYATYCANCHMKDGKGLAAVFPPLAGSDYLMENMARAACIIKNGQADEIVVNGVTYQQMMPANEITNLEIAEVLTYITNTWGNSAGLHGVKEVDKWLKDCKE